MKTIGVIGVIFILICLVAMADAAQISVTGVAVKATFTEPSDNMDGSALTDLASVSVFYDMGAGEVLGIMIPASSPTGGQSMTGSFEVPVTAGMEKVVNFWATASDISGNMSDKSQIISVRIDRLAPSAPK